MIDLAKKPPIQTLNASLYIRSICTKNQHYLLVSHADDTSTKYYNCSLCIFAVQKWRVASNDTKVEVQHMLHCCGFDDPNLSPGDPSGMGHPPCWQVRINIGNCTLQGPFCYGKWQKIIPGKITEYGKKEKIVGF